jgi:threonylcarbamoyladenosine tRNA methylthiotransferase MtaB
VLDRLRTRYPSIAIGTDIIVGFPGESEADFRESIRTVEEYKFAYVHQFSFSARSGTAAATLERTVPPQSIAERVEQLREVASQTGREYRKRFVGARLRSVVSPDRQNKHYRAVSSNYIRMSLTDSPLNAAACGTLSEVKILETDNRQTVGIVTKAPNVSRT